MEQGLQWKGNEQFYEQDGPGAELEIFLVLSYNINVHKLFFKINH
jgi:hypothetical protein